MFVSKFVLWSYNLKKYLDEDILVKAGLLTVHIFHTNSTIAMFLKQTQVKSLRIFYKHIFFFISRIKYWFFYRIPRK